MMTCCTLFAALSLLLAAAPQEPQKAPAGDFALFRDHFELCRKRWAKEELHREAELIGKRIESKRKLAARFWLLLALGVMQHAAPEPGLATSDQSSSTAS